ncbi:MAG TPA: SCO2322 family protein [Acidothermaceae bacterium]
MIRAASWVVAALSCLAGVAAFTVATPAPASASTAYRYWAFYLAHGSTWQYSQRGPASEYPVDGDVEGWRFAIQVDAATGLSPRQVPDFAALCASTPAKAGEIRVGLVIDFGVAIDAPAHESPPAGVVPGCIYVHAGDSGAAVLQAATTVRIGTGSRVGLVCGIDGYPKTECTPAVTAPTASTPGAHPSTTPSSTPPQNAQAPTAPPAPLSSAAPASASSITPGGSIDGSLTPSDPASLLSSSASAIVPLGAAGQPTSLASLRSTSHSTDPLEYTALIGVVLVVVIGGAAFWRTRRGQP